MKQSEKPDKEEENSSTWKAKKSDQIAQKRVSSFMLFIIGEGCFETKEACGINGNQLGENSQYELLPHPFVRRDRFSLHFHSQSAPREAIKRTSSIYSVFFPATLSVSSNRISYPQTTIQYTRFVTFQSTNDQKIRMPMITQHHITSKLHCLPISVLISEYLWITDN